MANYYGIPDRQLWLACGGLKHMTLEAMQPLIDQGRKVWLWPDKDGVTAWQEVADKLGSDQVKVYTRFLDSCWTEDDGPKADAADIAIRMMQHPEFKPREVKPDDKHEPILIGDIVTHIVDDGEPFVDPIELQDPRVHRWREILRQKCNFNKKKT
jgi:hypothetical protein